MSDPSNTPSMTVNGMPYTPTADEFTEAWTSKRGPWVAGDLVSSEEPLRKTLYKVRDQPDRSDSAREPSNAGRLPHPFDMELADSMSEVNPYHGSCQATLVSATSGMGIGIIDEAKTAEQRRQIEEMDMVDAASKLPVIDEEATAEAYDILDDLCEHDFDSLLMQVVGNYWGIGQGYMEVVRDDDDPISALYWQPGTEVFRHFPGEAGNRSRDRYLFVTSPYISQSSVYYSRWRKLDTTDGIPEVSTTSQRKLTELIDFVRPTTRWEGYGSPHWLAAIPYMDVDVRSLQRVSDYMFNGGTPANMVFVGGMPIAPGHTDKMKKVMGGATGSKTGQSALFTFPNAPRDRAWVEHLKVGDSFEGTQFLDTHSTINLSVASANQVPPMLAGITTPGKMGAANEMAQAIMTLQTNVISPVQKYLAKRLMRTLFSTVGGVRGLTGKKIRFRTWVESMDMAALNTVARQRENVAANPNRNPDDGLNR